MLACLHTSSLPSFLRSIAAAAAAEEEELSTFLSPWEAFGLGVARGELLAARKPKGLGGQKEGKLRSTPARYCRTSGYSSNQVPRLSLSVSRSRTSSTSS